jgi:hypothetical protein
MSVIGFGLSAKRDVIDGFPESGDDFFVEHLHIEAVATALGEWNGFGLACNSLHHILGALFRSPSGWV